MWTKEPPTKNGYYWFAPSEVHKRRSIGEPPDPYPVWVVNAGTVNAGAYVPWDWEYDISLKEFDGLWHPATPPALPEESNEHD